MPWSISLSSPRCACPP
uniref:Uncharacterized protein n=1 Tax=Arundo donax TaxID=35708 RepID=A0A0A8ZSJ7_ARUDO